MIGAPDAERGQIVEAHVVLKAGVAGDADCVKRLQDHVKATIAPYKYPRSVKFIDALPKTQTGKIQRFRLKQGALSAFNLEIAMSNESFEILQPAGWTAPKGYANGIAAEGRQIFVAGQIGWNAEVRIDRRRFRRAGRTGAAQHRADSRGSRRQAAAPRAADLVRDRQDRIRGEPDARSARPTAASSASISRP